MTFKLAPRTRQFVTSTGAIGAAAVVDLGGVTNVDLNSFVDSVGDNNTTVVCFVSGNGIDWQECFVTVDDAAPDTLTINSIIVSSIAGVVGTSAITLAGTSKVFGIIPTDFDLLFAALYGSTVGSILYVDQVTGKWQSLARGPSGTVLRSTGSTISWGQTSQKEAGAVAADTPLPSSPTYNNGTAGTGATLTAGSNGGFTVDGVASAAFAGGERVLVAGQADAKQNGIYTLTQVGDGSHPYILTRATDWDGNAIGLGAGSVELGNTISIYGGASNSGLWAFTYYTPSGTLVFGVSEITWTKIASNTVGGATTLDGLSDVIITSPAADDFIIYNSGSFVNRTKAQATASLDAFVGDSGSGGTKGLVPAPGSGDAAAGKFLHANGAFAVPSGTGAMALIQTLTASSSATLDFTGLSAGSDYRLVGRGLVPATNAVSALIRVGAGSFSSSDYRWTYQSSGSDGSTGVGANASDSSFTLTGNVPSAHVTQEGVSFDFFIQITPSLFVRIMGNMIVENTNGVTYRLNYCGQWPYGGGTFSRIRFLYSSGNTAQGNLSLYSLSR